MSKAKIQKNVGIFKCPICGNKMQLEALKSLICTKNHCYDLSKSGYINLLLNNVKTEYDKNMFRSRSIVSQNGFFAPMVERISDIIVKHVKNEKVNNSIILDVGCGEGSNLQQLIDKLNAKIESNVEGVGIDISKEGIQIASKQYPDHVWCVGDLTKNPFMNKSFNIVLNILSPSNYEEFQRIMTDQGVLIKVVPGSNYLKELRKEFYDHTNKQSYSNEKVVDHFSKHFKLIDKEQIQYTVDLDQEYLQHLIKMTPLSWNASEEDIHNILNSGIEKITVDFTILYGSL